MEKKNSLLLTIIAIATLLVAVVGATFAYFASGATGANTTVNVTTASAASFSAVIDHQIEIYADATNMANEVGKKGVWNNTSTANITLTLTGDPGSYCTYKISYTDSGAEYVPSTGTNGGGLFLITSTTAGDNNSNLASKLNYTSETEYNLITNPIVTNSTSSDKSGGGYIMVPTSGTDATNRKTEYVVTVTAKWYNLNTDQLSNAGKTFAGTLAVENVKCYDPNGNPLT